MLRTAFALLLLFFSEQVLAQCGISVSFGHSHLTGIPIEKVDDKLNTEFTRVESRVDSVGSAKEFGIECATSKTVSVSLSVITGLSLRTSHDIYFKGYEGHGVELSPQYLVTLHQEVEAQAQRISVLKYFDYGNISPYGRFGIEHVTATHRAYIPIGPYELSRTERKSVTAPYLALGLAFYRNAPISARIEYQVESVGRHKLTTTMIGLDMKLQL